MPPERPIQVGIGLIVRRGSYLIRRRPPLPGSPMPGLWEFPGGKCEVGETPSQASKRECREEVGVEVVIGRLRRVTTHQYAHGFIELQYFDASTLDPRAEPDPNSGFVWVPASNLDQYTFPEANEPIIAELMGSWES